MSLSEKCGIRSPIYLKVGTALPFGVKCPREFEMATYCAKKAIGGDSYFKDIYSFPVVW